MSRIHLPESIYERLPMLYLTLAALLVIAATTAVKWPVIGGLLLAAAVIHRRRRSYRAALRWRQAAAFIDKLERSRKKAGTSSSSTVEVT